MVYDFHFSVRWFSESFLGFGLRDPYFYSLKALQPIQQLLLVRVCECFTQTQFNELCFFHSLLVETLQLLLSYFRLSPTNFIILVRILTFRSETLQRNVTDSLSFGNQPKSVKRNAAVKKFSLCDRHHLACPCLFTGGSAPNKGLETLWENPDNISDFTAIHDSI